MCLFGSQWEAESLIFRRPEINVLDSEWEVESPMISHPTFQQEGLVGVKARVVGSFSEP